MDQSYDEKQLIEKISDGDVHAFEQVFNTYFHYLHNVAYNRLHSGQAADDIVQDVFTDLWKNRLSLNIHTSLEAYLYQAVKNKVFKYIRYQVVREKEVYINRIRDEYYSLKSVQNAEELIEYDELQGLIKHQLDCLPEKTQRIFNLSRKEHYTHCEIAEKLNCSPKTVEYHIGKALQHLRFNLKDHITILITFILLSIAVY